MLKNIKKINVSNAGIFLLILITILGIALQAPLFQNNKASAMSIRTTACPNRAAAIYGGLSMWVWHNTSEITAPGTQAQSDLFNFTDSHKIKTIYLSLWTGFFDNSTNVLNLKTFLNTAKNIHCLEVEALSGESNWIALTNSTYFTSGTKTNSALDFARAIKNFNSSIATGNAKLVGVQYDVEPYLLKSTSGYKPYWDENDSSYTPAIANQKIGNAMIDMLLAVKNTLAGTGILLDVAPPRWYDTKSSLQNFVRTGGATGKNLMQYISDTADVITIQDYVNTTSSIYSDGKNEIDYAASIGKKVRFGVLADTSSTSSSTFFGTSCAYLNNTLSATYSMFNSAELSGFGGFAVEHYKDANNTPAAYSVVCP